MPLDCLCYCCILIIMERVIKVALYQGYHGEGVPDEIAEKIIRENPDILCLPEYFLVSPDEPSILPSAEHHEERLKYLKTLSVKLNCAITGCTLLHWTKTGLKNTCYFISNGKILGFYEKIHLHKNEGEGMVVPGIEYKVIFLNGLRVGLLICADVLHPESYRNLLGLRPDIVIIPVTAPYQRNETSKKKFARDKILFERGAKILGCPVVKVSSIGRIAGHQVQGRSLVATPDGIIFRVPPENEDKAILKIMKLSL